MPKKPNRKPPPQPTTHSLRDAYRVAGGPSTVPHIHAYKWREHSIDIRRFDNLKGTGGTAMILHEIATHYRRAHKVNVCQRHLGRLLRKGDYDTPVKLRATTDEPEGPRFATLDDWRNDRPMGPAA